MTGPLTVPRFTKKQESASMSSNTTTSYTGPFPSHEQQTLLSGNNMSAPTMGTANSAHRATLPGYQQPMLAPSNNMPALMMITATSGCQEASSSSGYGVQYSMAVKPGRAPHLAQALDDASDFGIGAGYSMTSFEQVASSTSSVLVPPAIVISQPDSTYPGEIPRSFQGASVDQMMAEYTNFGDENDLELDLEAVFGAKETASENDYLNTQEYQNILEGMGFARTGRSDPVFDGRNSQDDPIADGGLFHGIDGTYGSS